MTESSPSVPSLWAATAAAAPPTTPLDGHITVDVAVIGAGFAGLSAALHVAEAGRSVAVLEAQEVGHGGAGRNNGQVILSLTRSDPADLRRRFGVDRGNRLARLVAGSAAFTFDLKTQERLGLGDIFSDLPAALAVLSDLAGRRLEAELGGAPFPEGYAPKADNFQSFVLDGNDIVVTFPPYQVASFAEGTQTVRVALNHPRLLPLLSPALKAARAGG